MTAMTPNSEFMLFISHVETDGLFFKIWGQLDRNAVTRVEHIISSLSEQFAQGLGLPSQNYPIPLNAICCACFQNEGYYRAKICNVQPGGNVLVHFIDYGNFEILPRSAIRLLDNIPAAVVLLRAPPLALDFVLANILPTNGAWDMEAVESMKQTLRYATVKGLLHSAIGSYRLLKLWYNNEDLGTTLVNQNVAINATLQEMFLRRQQQLAAPNMNTNREHPPQGMEGGYNSPRNHQPPFDHRTALQEDWRNPAQRQPPQNIPEALVFKTRVLDIGSVHNVYVSCVEDGPLKFAVQVQSTSQILKQLMNEINYCPTAPLQEPPLPGTVCLGRFSIDKVLCRAVVMSVMEHKCKLYYVDFGHTETLPYSDIFQLPPQYINPRVLSIRFTLSGLKGLVITDAVKEYFKTIVTGKPLVLQVKPPEGPPLIQYGELYKNGSNIRDLLREHCSPQTVYQKPVRLQKGMKELVHVSFVESCSKFFVQRDGESESLNSIMACLAEYANNAPQLAKNSLRLGMPCCACYGEDKLWYRAQILNISVDQVTVLYVDYGNEETVDGSLLKKIHSDLVTNLPAQAIKCCLNEYQSAAFNQEIANQFELLVLEKRLVMEVLESHPDRTIVQLFDCTVVPMVNIASQLRAPNISPRAGSLNTSQNSSRDGGEQIANVSKSPEQKYQAEDRNAKWSKNSKPNTWGQETRSGDWNSRARNNTQEGKEQFEEKMRVKNVKDVENEQRQRENNRHEGDDRLHQKDTRNNYFNRSHDSPGGNRYERNEETRRGKGNRFGSSGRMSREDNRFDKSINKDDSWSDRDSDSSSRSGGKRGSRGPRGIKGRTDRGGGRASGERKITSGKWSDGDSDRSSQKSTQGSYRSRERTSPNFSSRNSKTPPNRSVTWETMSPTSPSKESPRALQNQRIPPPNITVGAVKNSEITYINSPTDFYVQLCPDNLELDKLMERIAQKYNKGGKTLKKSDIQPGISCIAQYSCDSKWYRAIVKSNNADIADVHFIDYGNTEAVGHDKIKELEPEFAKLSAQAVHCKLFSVAKSSWTDQEIDKFAESAEGIPLEAEFLLQDNMHYEVLIKPVDCTSKDEYINKIFSGNTDLIQAKKDIKNKTKRNFNSNSTKTSPREKPQYIQLGQKWSDETFPAGYQVDVVVTWFVNPNNFYCQILSKQSEFKTMMNNIQESYVDQQPIRNTLQVGEPVIAFFSDDGALYRAEIKELNKLRGHIVQYIDFGNCAMVDPCKIYPVEKRFAVLPKQAMHCSLKNVSPIAGNDWSSANKHDIDKYFDSDTYKCTFHGNNNGKYIISLSHRGKDIGEAMINARLAINPEIKINKVVIDEVQSAERNPIIDNLESKDLTLWNGQIIRTTVHDFQSAAKFHIQLPNQLVECYLLNVTPSPQLDETLQKSIEGKDVIVSIKNVNNQRFAVELFNASGKKVKLTDTEIEGTISPVCPMPILSSKDKVWVTHIENSEDIWLQRSSDSETIAKLLSSLYEYYSVSGELLIPEKGKLCVAESNDKNWYRAKIENIKESEVVEVRFIDYGNTEEIPTSGIKTLEQKFYTPYQLAINVSLVVELKGTKEEQKNMLHENLDDKEFEANFYNINNKWLVELYDNQDNKKISEKFSELNLVETIKDIKPPQQEIPEMIVGNKYEVFVCHSDSPAQFWLQRNEEIDTIESMQESLQIEAPSFSAIKGIPEEGSLCAALYSVDGMWYRAEVLDADEDITTVRFIDYGNPDIVDSNSNKIKELPQSWKSVKKYALKSRLDLIPIGSEDWSTTSCEMFEKMATENSSPITALIIADSVPRRVELFVDNNSIGDMLVKEGHAVMVHNAEDLIDEIIELELDPRAAFVCHINSPSEFWVQEEKSVSDLEIMSDRFIVAEMFPKLDEIVDGALCVAKFPDDEQWYRARVMSHDLTSGTKVLFIDYGNSSVSTELRVIPQDLASVAPLSRKCCLQLPPGVQEWSAEACDKFIDLAADGATIFLLDVIKQGDTSLVTLNLEGVNVADVLKDLCDLLPVIDERLPPLGEENSPNVVVSHVSSPSEFWTQAESSMSELEIMASRLIDAQSLLPLNIFDEGTICAAKFPEDGEWYRAKILSHGEFGTNVLYFDYGNSALTTELRILPEDVANIPSLASRCTLELPEDIESWSEEASAKFNELVAEGATMFQFEILDNNDPMKIALQLEGKDVIDILKPLCRPTVLTEEFDRQVIEPLMAELVNKATESEEKSKQDEIIEPSTTEIFDRTTEGEEESKIDEIKKEIEDTENPEIIPTDNLEVLQSDCDDLKNTQKTQSDNLDVPEAEKSLSNGLGHSYEIQRAETDKSEAEKILTTFWDNFCDSTKQIVTDISGIPKSGNILDTEKAPLGDNLVPEQEITEEISENLVSQNIINPTDKEPVDNIAEVIEPKVEKDLENPNDKPVEENGNQEKEPAVDIADVIQQLKLETNPENPEHTPIEENGCDTLAAMDTESISEEVKKESETETVTELTVDDIVGNMVKVALIEGANDTKVNEEMIASGEISEEKIVEQTEKLENGTADVINDSAVGTPVKTPKMDKIVPGSISRGSLEEDVSLNILARRRSSCSDDRIVPGSINKGNDIPDPEIIDLVSPESHNKIPAVTQDDINVQKEDPIFPNKMQRDQKIVPGCISRGESPMAELNRPTTPKTPHSEKLLAGVVNLQENLEYLDEQDSEILVVEVESDIPENKSS